MARARAPKALLLAIAIACAIASAPACNADPACAGAACSAAGASGGGASQAGDGAGGGGVPVITQDDACAMQVERAQRGPSKPLDLIFVIDNSASMGEEIAAVRSNINTSFAAIIQQSGADFRVIMLSQYGPSGTDVCIEPPLAGAECSTGLASTNGPSFFHYNVEIDSMNSLCKLLETFDASDAEGRAPGGWQQYLRADSQKAFIVITDDSAFCAYEDDDVSVSFGMPKADPFEDALMFHSVLMAKSPEQFGIPPDVRYRFYSFVGLQENEPVTQPYFPHQDLSLMTCDTAPSPGVVYQALSVVTDALRYPVCEGRGFDAVFRVLAQNVVESIKAECTFQIPTAPEEQVIDERTISLRYQSGESGEPLQLGQVSSFEECDGQSFYIKDDQLELCAESCATVQADPDAQLEVLYGCMYMVQ